MSEVQPANEAETTTEDELQASDAPLLDVDATAARLTEIASQSLDNNEVARQIEELTSVVLDSAEVSTRSASIAADVSATMRAVVTKIQETNQRNVLHSRIMLGAFVACLVIAMAVFFGVTIKMTKSIKELDTMIYAMAKRVIEVDASLTAISKTHSDFAGLAEKQEEMTTTQTRLAARLDEIGRSLSGMPVSMAEQSNKTTDPKFQLMMKQLQTMETRLGGVDTKMQAIEAKVQSVESHAQAVESKMGGIDSKLLSVSQAVTAKPAAPTGPSPQSVLQELHKLKQDMESSNKKTQEAAERALSKANEKAETAAAAAARAAASEKAASAERAANQRAAAEQAAMERADPDRANRLAAQRAAAEKAAAEKAAAKKKAEADKAATDKAAAEKAAAQKAAEKAAAEKAAADKAAAERAAERVRLLREQATQQNNSRVQFPRTPAESGSN